MTTPRDPPDSGAPEGGGTIGLEAREPRSARAEFRGGVPLDRRAAVLNLPRDEPTYGNDGWLRWAWLGALTVVLGAPLSIVGLLLSATGFISWWAATAILALLLALGWGFLAGGRWAIVAERGFLEFLVRPVLRRAAPVPVVDEAPAQLLRRRGRYQEAAASYDRWIEEHPQSEGLHLRRAEILWRDLRRHPDAIVALEGIVARLQPREAALSDGDLEILRLARAFLDEVRRAGAEVAAPARPTGPTFRG